MHIFFELSQTFTRVSINRKKHGEHVFFIIYVRKHTDEKKENIFLTFTIFIPFSKCSISNAPVISKNLILYLRGECLVINIDAFMLNIIVN